MEDRQAGRSAALCDLFDPEGRERAANFPFRGAHCRCRGRRYWTRATVMRRAMAGSDCRANKAWTDFSTLCYASTTATVTIVKIQ